MLRDEQIFILLAGWYMLTRGTRSLVDWGTGWVFPAPVLVYASSGQYPQITQGFRAADHRGVDICYDMGQGPRKTMWGAPPGTPVLAARGGTVWSVTHTARGWAVVLDHQPPFATFYTHLSEVDPSLQKGRPVAAGQQIGVMGADPTDAEHVVHLHFEVWHGGASDKAIDPAPAMASWTRYELRVQA